MAWRRLCCRGRRLLAAALALTLLAACGGDTVEESPAPSPEPTEEVTPTPTPDLEAPVILGVQDLTAQVGETLSYRAGVTVTDNVDEKVALRVDASQVDMTRPGIYTVIYSAADSSGNEASVAATVTVQEVQSVEHGDEPQPEVAASGIPADLDEDTVNALADQVLAQITTADMTAKQKAKAIYDYVHSHIRYVGSSDKTNWLVGAYVGFTRGRGDCYNYFACSKALLTRAGIPNVDLSRTGGNTDHYWQLVDVGEGYYHFDACPHPNNYPIYSFLLTENQVRAYTKQCSGVRKNYYVYDYDSCPVSPVMGPQVSVPTATPAPTPEPSQEVETSPGPEETIDPEASQDPLLPPDVEAPPSETETVTGEETPPETFPTLPPEGETAAPTSEEVPPETGPSETESLPPPVETELPAATTPAQETVLPPETEPAPETTPAPETPGP